jgi:aspartyl protease family protein
MSTFTARLTRPTFALGAALAILAVNASAQTISFSGHIGEHKALLVIDGEPVTLAVGDTARGVRLLSLSGGQAQIDSGGVRRTLALGAGAVRASSPQRLQGGGEIVMTAGRNGHFHATGAINGRAVQFMVDTGASLVSLGQADADRLGINYRAGRREWARTANGDVPIWITVLDSVRVGDVEIANVEAGIQPGSMGIVLLGNSFLTRFQMKRENDVLRLEKRP